MSPILDLQKRLVEVGRIRMGNKSAKGAPQKLEVFRVTSRDQARLEAIAGLYGGDVVPWAERAGEFEVITKTAELPILLLPGQALSQWNEMWSAGGCQRRCDGFTNFIADASCQCPPDPEERGKLAAKGKACKPTTRLSVMLPEIPGLGVFRLESHGYYAAVELAATAGMLEQATAQGQVFPARLRIDQRSQVKDGKTTRYAVPVIDIDVRLPEALGRVSTVGAIETPGGGGNDLSYRPIAELPAGMSVGEALEVTARQGKPKVTTARSAEPIGAAPDFMSAEAVPVPDDDLIDSKDSTDERAASRSETPAPVLSEGGSVDQAAGVAARTPQPQMPPNVPAGMTDAQSKKLGVLVRKLRDSGAIKTEHLWSALAKSRSYDTDQMIELLEGRDADGVLHWGPLLATVTRQEASELIDRLSSLEQVAA